MLYGAPHNRAQAPKCHICMYLGTAPHSIGCRIACELVGIPYTYFVLLKQIIKEDHAIVFWQRENFVVKNMRTAKVLTTPMTLARSAASPTLRTGCVSLH